MNRVISLTAMSCVLALLGGVAHAGPSCDVPKDKWMKESDFKAKLEQDGYQIKTFKVSKGNCYEIYGHDKGGKKVEIYFDPGNGSILEQK